MSKLELAQLHKNKCSIFALKRRDKILAFWSNGVIGQNVSSKEKNTYFQTSELPISSITEFNDLQIMFYNNHCEMKSRHSIKETEKNCHFEEVGTLLNIVLDFGNFIKNKKKSVNGLSVHWRLHLFHRKTKNIIKIF